MDKDQRQTIILFGIIAFALVTLGVVFFLVVIPAVNDAVAPGLGLKSAAIISFVVTLATIVILAVFSGDGLIGEIQYVLPGFFVFFLINWILIAWTF